MATLRDRRMKLKAFTACFCLWSFTVAVANDNVVSQATIDAWIIGIQSSDEDIRLESAQALAEIGTPAVPSLIKTMASKDWKSCHVSIRVLAKIGRPAIPPLMEILTSTDPILRSRAAFTLAQIGPEAKAALEPLIDLLKDPSEQVRMNAVVALSHIGTDARQALPDLYDLLEKEKRKSFKFLIREAIKNMEIESGREHDMSSEQP